jgi:hypothetical protein
VKALLAEPGDRLEVPVGRFVVDLVRADGELVEVQTGVSARSPASSTRCLTCTGSGSCTRSLPSAGSFASTSTARCSVPAGRRSARRRSRYANDDEIRHAFYEAPEDAGLGYLRTGEEPIVFHDLRHTFGTQCAVRGIDIVKIQAWMGHADIQTTKRYMHYVPQHDDAARLTAAFTAKTMPSTVPRTALIRG